MARLPKLPTPKSIAPRIPSVPQDAAKAGYAVLGATEIAAQHARDAQDRLKSELSRERVSQFVNDQLAEQKRRVAQRRSEVDEQLRRVAELPRQARQIPGAAMEQGLAVSSRAEHTYDDLASRGREVAHRLKTQQGADDSRSESPDDLGPVEAIEVIEVVETPSRPSPADAARTDVTRTDVTRTPPKKKSPTKVATRTPKASAAKDRTAKASAAKGPAAKDPVKKSSTAKKSPAPKPTSTGEGTANQPKSPTE